MEEEEHNSKPKVRINVAMVGWDKLVVDVCVSTQGQRENMSVKDPLEKEVSPIKGRQTKWEK